MYNKETDEALPILRDPLLSVRDAKKPGVMKMINKLLDERLSFMKVRDEK